MLPESKTPGPVRCSVAAVIRKSPESAFLAVRRPLDDDLLPGMWGLPALTLSPGELPEAGIARLGLEKLGVNLRPVSFVGIRSADRGAYELILMDIEAEVVSGEPDVKAATSLATTYIDQQWTDDTGLLADAAARGSLCCQILIDASTRSPGTAR